MQHSLKQTTNMSPEITELIFRLIEAGEDLTDAAETCGHDEALEDWNKIVKKVKKKLNLQPEVLKQMRAEAASKKEAIHKKKEETYLANQAREAEIVFLYLQEVHGRQ